MLHASGIYVAFASTSAAHVHELTPTACRERAWQGSPDLDSYCSIGLVLRPVFGLVVGLAVGLVVRLVLKGIHAVRYEVCSVYVNVR